MQLIKHNCVQVGFRKKIYLPAYITYILYTFQLLLGKQSE